jgi:hydroxypyruvate reductase
MLNSPAQSLERLFLSAVAAVSPSASLAGHWPAPPAGRLAVLAIGKCAAAMAGAATAHYGRRTAGLVLVPDGHLPDASPGRALVVMHSSHPVPDQRSVAAADAALALAASLGPDDLLLVLLSGGHSRVDACPRPPGRRWSRWRSRTCRATIPP